MFLSVMGSLKPREERSVPGYIAIRRQRPGYKSRLLIQVEIIFIALGSPGLCQGESGEVKASKGVKQRRAGSYNSQTWLCHSRPMRPQVLTVLSGPGL